ELGSVGTDDWAGAAAQPQLGAAKLGVEAESLEDPGDTGEVAPAPRATAEKSAPLATEPVDRGGARIEPANEGGEELGESVRSSRLERPSLREPIDDPGPAGALPPRVGALYGAGVLELGQVRARGVGVDAGSLGDLREAR